MRVVCQSEFVCVEYDNVLLLLLSYPVFSPYQDLFASLDLFCPPPPPPPPPPHSVFYDFRYKLYVVIWHVTMQESYYVTIARAPGGHERLMLTKLGGGGGQNRSASFHMFSFSI